MQQAAEWDRLPTGEQTGPSAPLPPGGANGSDPCRPPSGGAVTRPGNVPPSPDHGLNATRFRAYWSADPDYETTGLNMSNVSSAAGLWGALACSRDLTFDRPPEVRGWNAGEHGEFVPGGRNQSVYPTGTALGGSTLIEDAYLRIFAVDPATIVHRPSGRVRYIRPQGRVRTVMDYRVERPPDYDGGALVIQRNIDDIDLENVTLWANGTVVDRASGRTPRFQFSGLGGSGPVTLTVRTRINVTVFVDRFYCPDYNSTTGHCRVPVQRTQYHYADTHVVSDSRTYRVQDYSETTTGSLGQFPNGTRLYLNVSQPWANATVPGLNATVTNRWAFYTRSPSDWTQFHETNGNYTIPVNGTIRPLEVHAVPVRCNLQTNQSLLGEPRLRNPVADTCRNHTTSLGRSPGNRSVSDPVRHGVQLTQLFGRLADSPHLPTSVTLTTPNKTRGSSGFVVRSESSSLTSATVRLQGIVRGPPSTVQITGMRDVHRANLTLWVDNRTGQTVTFAASARTRTGQPLTSGTITIATTRGTRTVDLSTLSTGGSSGPVVYVTIQHNRSVVPAEARYRSPTTRWWTVSRPTTTTRVQTVALPKFVSFQLVLDLLLVTTLWFGALAIAIYGMDYLTRGRLIGRFKR